MREKTALFVTTFLAIVFMVMWAGPAQAGSYTDMGYYKPSTGEINYATSVNANFDKNDELAKGWVLTNWTFAYVSSTSFTVVGDKTGYFTPNRQVKAVFSGGTTATGVVASSSYVSPNTTVTLRSAILNNTLSTVELSLALPVTGIPVSSTDTSPNYLFNKLTAGSGISITKTNSGGNEGITIANTQQFSVVAGSVTYSPAICSGQGYITVTQDGGAYTVNLTLGTNNCGY